MVSLEEASSVSAIPRVQPCAENAENLPANLVMGADAINLIAQRESGLGVAHFGNGKPMAIQAQAMLKTHLSLSSWHDAKQAGGIKGSRNQAPN